MKHQMSKSGREHFSPSCWRRVRADGTVLVRSPTKLAFVPDVCYLCGMKPWCRFALVLFAYGMALLHTAVPHHHLQVSGAGPSVAMRHGCNQSHVEGGLLQRALSTDLGIGHLETFNKNSDTPLTFGTAVFLFAFVNTCVAADSGHELTSAGAGDAHIDAITRWQRLFSAASFRGPPVA